MIGDCWDGWDGRQCHFRQRLRCGRATQLQKRAFCSCGACGCAPQTPSIDTHDQRDTTANRKTAENRHSQIPRHCRLETGRAPQVQNMRYCSCVARDGHPQHTKHALSEAKRPLRAQTTSLSITQRSQPGINRPNHFTENARQSQTATTCSASIATAFL